MLGQVDLSKGYIILYLGYVACLMVYSAICRTSRSIETMYNDVIRFSKPVDWVYKAVIMSNRSVKCIYTAITWINRTACWYICKYKQGGNDQLTRFIGILVASWTRE